MPARKPAKKPSIRTLPPVRRLALLLDTRELPLLVRVHPSSRRLVLRYCPKQQAATLTLPRWVSLKKGVEFAESRKAWLRAQISEQPGRVPFADGAVLAVRGERLTVRHVPGGRGVAWREGEFLNVGGTADGLPSRVRTWLVNQAKADIAPRARALAAQTGKRITRLSFRDPTSRWGSCASDGAVSFSWRLVLAPPAVMEYVICHEIAHLSVLDHSPRFWKMVEGLCPGHEAAREWLRAHGQSLHAVG